MSQRGRFSHYLLDFHSCLTSTVHTLQSSPCQQTLQGCIGDAFKAFFFFKKKTFSQMSEH